jgi:hypothetical protein
VTIPVDARRRMERRTGDRIAFVELDDGGYLIGRSLRGLLRKLGKSVRVDDIDAAIRSRAAAGYTVIMTFDREAAATAGMRLAAKCPST